MAVSAPFRIEETHGILSRPENKIRASSDRFGWSSLYASAQREIPYEGYFPAVKDQLIVQHLDGPVPIDRLHGPNPARCVVPAGGLHLVPGGLDFGVRLMGALSTLHVYVRRSDHRGGRRPSSPTAIPPTSRSPRSSSRPIPRSTR